MILSCQGIHAWEMIDSLVWFHAVKFIDLDCAVGPEKIPLVVRIRIICHVGSATQSHFELFGNISDDIIFGL